MYGVATDGNLYKINMTTAEETLVGPTGITISDPDNSYFFQSGEIDRKDNTFYWGRNRQTLWGGCTDANPKLLLNDT